MHSEWHAHPIQHGAHVRGWQCSICQEEYNEDDVLRCLPCNHAEHAECLEPWLQINKSCPLCQCEVQIGAPPASTLDKALVGTPPTPASLPVETPLAGLTSAPVEPLADANTNVVESPAYEGGCLAASC